MTDTFAQAPRVSGMRRVATLNHLFHNGQAVRFKNTMLSAGGVYQIVASLPPLGATPQYRIRSENEKFERMASESDIELAGDPPLSEGGARAAKLFAPKSLV
jgi:hypothetical protein